MAEPSTHNTPNANQQKILKIKSEHPDLSTRKIAAIAKTSNFAVHNAIKRYGVDQGALESYQAHRADIFDALQQRILSSITSDDINKATLMQRMASVGVLYDKMRIERGLSDGSSKPMVMIQVNGASVSTETRQAAVQPEQVIDVSD